MLALRLAIVFNTILLATYQYKDQALNDRKYIGQGIGRIVILGWSALLLAVQEAYELLSSANVPTSFETDKQALLPKLLGIDRMVSQGMGKVIAIPRVRPALALPTRTAYSLLHTPGLSQLETDASVCARLLRRPHVPTRMLE